MADIAALWALLGNLFIANFCLYRGLPLDGPPIKLWWLVGAAISIALAGLSGADFAARVGAG